MGRIGAADFGLIGYPLTHSYSAQIHEELSLKPYALIPLEAEELPDFLKRREFRGINVTIPYKEAVIPYLDGLDESARSIGAVNTILKEGGRLIGYNTDADGFERMLAFHGISARHKKVLILGSGGTAKTVKSILIRQKAKEIYIVSRKPGKDEISYGEAQKMFSVQMIVNATPNGMYPHEDDPVLLDLSAFPYLEAVVDAVYRPFRTRLLLDARAKGCRIASGLYMLIAQGFRAQEIFNHRAFDSETCTHLYHYFLRETANIVLIGMPSVGKTTAGRNLANLLKKEFYDTDQEIEKDTKLTVKEIFSQYGEAQFRHLETEKVRELTRRTGIVISTGGGTLLSEENARLLAQNGYLIFLNRDLSLLKKNTRAALTRPLLEEENSFDRLYRERCPIYRKWCDLELRNNSTQWNTLNEIVRKLI